MFSYMTLRQMKRIYLDMKFFLNMAKNEGTNNMYVVPEEFKLSVKIF